MPAAAAATRNSRRDCVESVGVFISSRSIHQRCGRLNPESGRTHGVDYEGRSPCSAAGKLRGLNLSSRSIRILMELEGRT
jgi:hypothetical protein